MTIQEDLLPPFIETADNNKSRFLFRFIAILYIAQMLIVALVQYASIRVVLKIGTITSYPFLIGIILSQRIVPLITLVLYLIKKRLGWILIAFLSSINVLIYGMDIIQLIALSSFNNKGTNIRILINSVPLTLSSTILILILQKPVTQLFSISKNTRIYVIAAAIIISVAFKFYITDLILKMSQPKSITQKSINVDEGATSIFFRHKELNTVLVVT